MWLDDVARSIPVENFLLKLSIGFIIFVFLLESYINWRQHKRLQGRKMPALLPSLGVDEEKFLKSQAYGLDKSTFGFIAEFFQLFISIGTLTFGNVWLWNTSKHYVARITDATGYFETSDTATAAVFIALFIPITTLLGLPTSLYSTFVIEEKHGFNKQTLGIFFGDLIKSTLISLVITVPLVAAILWVIEWGGPYFYIYTWIFVLVVSFVMMTIYPSVIAPLFNTYTPIPEGELRDKIVALATKLKFPLTKLFLVDGSRHSAHSNAYFYGLFNNKRIVLYDTLLKELDTDQIMAVLAHEFGHWAMSHTLKQLLISQVHIFLIFFLFGQVTNSTVMYEHFGFDTKSTFPGLLCFSLLLMPFEHVTSLVFNAWSRSREFEADEYAVKLGYTSLMESLKKLHSSNLGSYDPDPLYSAYHYSHPPLIERLNAITAAEAKYK